MDIYLQRSVPIQRRTSPPKFGHNTIRYRIFEDTGARIFQRSSRRRCSPRAAGRRTPGRRSRGSARETPPEHDPLFRTTATTHHSFRGSFEAGSTPIFALKIAFFSIFQNLSKSFKIFQNLSKSFKIFQNLQRSAKILH